MQKVYFQNKVINHITVGKFKMKIEAVGRSTANCIEIMYQQGKILTVITKAIYIK